MPLKFKAFKFVKFLNFLKISSKLEKNQKFCALSILGAQYFFFLINYQRIKIKNSYIEVLQMFNALNLYVFVTEGL